MTLHELPASLSNADFFLRHARVGMIGLIAAEGRSFPGIIRHVTGMKRFGGTGRPSFWSHSFVIADIVTSGPWKAVVITESTFVPSSHLLAPSLLPEQPDWDGPQWSILVASHEQGAVLGQYSRHMKRRYISPEYVSNVALIDTDLHRGSQGALVGQSAWESLVPETRYAQLELAGFVMASLMGDPTSPAPFNSDDLFCSSYVRQVLGPLLPPLESALHTRHESNTTCEHLYRAALQLYDVSQIVRNPDCDASDWEKTRARLETPLEAALEQGPKPANILRAHKAPLNTLPPWRRPGLLHEHLDRALQRDQGNRQNS